MTPSEKIAAGLAAVPEEINWEGRKQWCKKRVQEMIHTRAELYAIEAIDELAAAQAEIERLREDEKRLDFLEKTVAVDGLYAWPHFDPISQNPECRFAWYTVDREYGPFDTLREAIDAALPAPAAPPRHANKRMMVNPANASWEPPHEYSPDCRAAGCVDALVWQVKQQQPRRMQGTACPDRLTECEHRKPHDEIKERPDLPEKYHQATCKYHGCQPVAPVEPPKPEPRKQWLFTQGGKENYADLKVQFPDGKGFITTGSVVEVQQPERRISRETLFKLLNRWEQEGDYTLGQFAADAGIVVEE